MGDPCVGGAPRALSRSGGTRSGTPGWGLPVLGGAVFAGSRGGWLTSALWFFTTTGLTF
ncbi:MAG TPA: DUF6529 family protein [Pseudonocardia sp.]|nr:DUF6529 family protein [Pseudonocardia sp.]